MTPADTPFRVILLFSKPFEFVNRELFDGIAGSYPGLALQGGSDPCRQNYVGAEPLETRVLDASGAPVVTLFSAPGKGTLQPLPSLKHSYPCAATRYGTSSIQATVTVEASMRPDAMTDGILAASQVTAVSAALAVSSNCAGIYVPSARMIVSPERWRRAAQEAAKGGVPIDAWVAFSVARSRSRRSGAPLTECRSLGLSAFNGQEVLMPWAEVSPGAATTTVYQALWLMLVNGTVFQDRDTMGPDWDLSAVQIRWADAGDMGLTTPGWVLFCRECVLPEDASSRAPVPRTETTRRPLGAVVRPAFG